MKNGRKLFSNNEIINPLLVFGSCGAISVLLDFDHIPVLVQKGLPVTAENLLYQAARPAHYPVFILLGIICIISYASLIRLRNKEV